MCLVPDPVDPEGHVSTLEVEKCRYFSLDSPDVPIYRKSVPFYRYVKNQLSYHQENVAGHCIRVPLQQSVAHAFSLP